MKVTIEAATFRLGLPKRASKNWGMVAELRCWVMILVLLPRIDQAIREPIRAFPMPIHVAATPYFHPNWPA